MNGPINSEKAVWLRGYPRYNLDGKLDNARSSWPDGEGHLLGEGVKNVPNGTA
jgi:hypothetical protein